MESILAFLNQIKKNNSKEWLDAHRTEYQAATQSFNLLVEKLIAGISGFDTSIKGLTVKDCTYRFNRDIRFSANKMPYKTHFGAFICPNGKKSGFSGYYFHIEPTDSGFLNGSMLCAGLYSPQPIVLKSTREEIYLNGDSFEKAVREAKSFVFVVTGKQTYHMVEVILGTEENGFVTIKNSFCISCITINYFFTCPTIIFFS